MKRLINTVILLAFSGSLWAIPAGGEGSFLQLAQTTPASAPRDPDKKEPEPRVVPATVGGVTRPAAQPQRPRGQQTPQQPPQPPPQPQSPAPAGQQPAEAEKAPDEKQQTAPAKPPARPPAQSRRPAAKPGMSFAFKNASIESVVSTIMKELGYSYVIDPQVSGSVNVFTQGDVPKEQLFPILEQLLKMNGQAIVKQDDFYVILPLGQSPQIPGRILMRPQEPPPPEEQTPQPPPAEQPAGSPAQQPNPPPQQPPATPPQPAQQAPAIAVGEAPEAAQLEAEQGVITYIIPLHYIPSGDMVTMIKAFVSDGAQVVDFQTANLLIVTDFRANIQQVLNLVYLLDTQYFSINTVDLVSVRYNQAADVAEDLGKVFAPGDQAGGVRIVAIERLNSILVVTHAPSVMAEVRKWLDRLDAPSSGSNLKTFVYQVENNTAINIAEILAQLYEDGAGLPSGAAEEQEGARAEPEGRRREPGFVQQRSDAFAGGLGPSLQGGRSTQSGIRAVVSGNVKIIVNEFNNSLIIQGTESDYRFLEQTIRQLDVLPRQALIEAKIYSVELRNELKHGVAAFLQTREVPGEGEVLAPPTTGAISAPGAMDPGGAFSAMTRLIVGGQRQLDIVVNALRSRTNVEVLEAPTLLVLDGTEAQINVGAEVPVTTASFGDPLRSGTETAFVNSIQFRPTGTTLLLLPRISASGIVTMDLAIEVSSATGPGLTPTINRNYVRTSLIARDNETVAIAGVISDQFNLGRTRVPVLGDIPVLGALFGQTEKTKRRFELIFLITPRVIRNLPTAVELTLDFKRALRNAYEFIDRKEAQEDEMIQRRRDRDLQRQLEIERLEREGMPPPAEPRPPL